MFEIPIDDLRYHTNTLLAEEINWAREFYVGVETRYPTLAAFTKATLSPLCLTDDGEEKLLTTVTLSFCHVMKVSFPPKTKGEAEETVKEWLDAFLPCIVENRLAFHAPNPVQYEPIAAVSLYAAHTALNHFATLLDEELKSKDELDFDLCYCWEAVAFFRVLRSSLFLLTIGDDVHGCALLRGVMELIAKLTLAPDFKNEYVLFKKFNLYLQISKQKKEPLPTEMTDYLERYNEYKRNPESFLAYGWAKTKEGKCILTMKGLLTHGITKRPLDGLIQVSSEFVHEDYVGVGYDYPQIRKALIDYYFISLYAICHDKTFGDLVTDDIRKKWERLFDAAARTYKGEPPLSAVWES